MSSRNEILFEQSLKFIPGGVNSPVRAFRAVGGTPIFFQRGKGAYLYDADGKEYIDYVGSWGPMILGHAHPEVVAAVQRVAENSLSFGAPTETELEMAQLLCEMLPSIEQVRLVSSGTEATMTAIRLARGFTGRNAIIKFEGCYHGHGDALLVKAGSGALTFGNPSSAGVPPEVVAHTMVQDYNNAQQIKDTFAKMGDQIACVIVEPVAGNMNLIIPDTEFLQTLRELCTKHGAVLIFDEVMTGFRVSFGGAQQLYGIQPDLTTLGKIVGGGLPLGAYGGRADLMDQVLPAGKVFQAGTLSGNPLATAAGAATLRLLRDESPYAYLEQQGARLAAGLTRAAQAAGITAQLQRVGSMMTLFFCSQPVFGWHEASTCDRQLFAAYFWGLVDRGVYMPCSQFEALFFSRTHTPEMIDETVAAAHEVLHELA